MEQILEQVKKHIPVSWPLQSFIATNPLFDLTHLPMDEAITQIGKYSSLKGTLGFNEYHNQYRLGTITLEDLEFSVVEFLHDKKFSSLYKDQLLQCFIDNKFQVEIEDISEKNNRIYNNLIAKQIESNLYYPEHNKIRSRIIAFCNDFFDIGQAKWKMPFIDNNLFTTWLKYAKVEDKAFSQILSTVKSNSNEALTDMLSKLGIPPNRWLDYLLSIVFQLLGWCSVIKWLESRPDNPSLKRNAYITDILAIWLGYELLLKHKYNISYIEPNYPENKFLLNKLLIKYNLNSEFSESLNLVNLAFIWQRASEYNYQKRLMSVIINKPKLEKPEQIRLFAQAVFCIDTRSEGIRRYLEQLGHYKTYGFAGFFGIGFRLHDKKSDSCSLQCPAIVIPDVTLNNSRARTTFLKRLQESLVNIINQSKVGLFSPFILFDAVGTWFSASLLGRTLIPEFFIKWTKFKPKIDYTQQSIDVFNNGKGFTSKQLAEKLAFMLKAIGLTTNFAPFIIIVGHKAESENNPFQSSLDCGACGGNGGIPNAIAFCQAANDPKVREILAIEYSIKIPDDSYFISSCHNTTTDEFNYYNIDQLKNKNLDLFNQLRQDIKTAGNLLRQERLSNLHDGDDFNIRKSNWAELIPEMGLANNAAFIIGPRSITESLNLQRRTFLHSYDPELDPDGEILSFIFNAPVLVGHWINSQYYFSTTDSQLYGSGNKAIHNVVSGLGVMEGNFSDYKIGLPIQSVSCLDEIVHQPLRLLVVVYAKQEIVKEVIAKSPTIANIFNGRWAHLQVIEPSSYSERRVA